MVIFKGRRLFVVVKLALLSICCTFGYLLFSVTAHSAQLNVAYIEYPPYYSTTSGGDLDGIIIDIVRKVFKRSGVHCTYVSLPSKRIISDIEKGAPVASLGWFKTAEREMFAKFSLPIYINKPAGVVMLRDEANRFSAYNSFKDLMNSGLFKIGRIAGHSEGEYIDGILFDKKGQTVWVAATEVHLVKMLKTKRFDFILLPPEEIEVLAKSAGYSMNDFALQPMNDIRSGNARYIMYAKSIDDGLIKQIDNAIIEEVGDLIPSH